MIVRAGEQYGARATGVTLSRQQFEKAKERIAAKKLGGLVSVELAGYRDLSDRRFSKVVSVGMVEHVGKTCLKKFFEIVHGAMEKGASSSPI